MADPKGNFHYIYLHFTLVAVHSTTQGRLSYRGMDLCKPNGSLVQSWNTGDPDLDLEDARKAARIFNDVQEDSTVKEFFRLRETPPSKRFDIPKNWNA